VRQKVDNDGQKEEEENCIRREEEEGEERRSQRKSQGKEGVSRRLDLAKRGKGGWVCPGLLAIGNQPYWNKIVDRS
jgi:hypothetical protein